MVLISASLPDTLTDQILCYYVNATTQLQIAQIVNIPGLQFQRLVFPNQRFLFEATSGAILEIYIDTTQNSTPLKQIACAQLQVNQRTEKNSDRNTLLHASDVTSTNG
ncbi:MAG: DUF1830 domain-containing protein [Leptolyngbyaceae cyanobacterium CSU_1_3]|nr:DUF1830 domain-containing protein [Leptolyngbyaceae cyanobacterium CSU_1_3]